jgi:hypothetical protein
MLKTRNSGDRKSRKIFYKSDKESFIWAWEESANVNVWGRALTLEEIKERAKKMFSKDKLVFILQ